MELYRHFSGDDAGVTLTPEGYVAYCPDGYFWLSPACRHDPSSCIPIIAAGSLANHRPLLKLAGLQSSLVLMSSLAMKGSRGNGWIIDAQMQWATAYGFPAAIGIAASWDLYVHHAAVLNIAPRSP